MERVTKHFEEKLEELELAISTREQGINARKAYGERMGMELREIKKQIKSLASKGHSTKYLVKVRVDITEAFQQNTSIVSHLKKDMASLRHEAYCVNKAIEALK